MTTVIVVVMQKLHYLQALDSEGYDPVPVLGLPRGKREVWFRLGFRV